MLKVCFLCGGDRGDLVARGCGGVQSDSAEHYYRIITDYVDLEDLMVRSMASPSKVPVQT